MGGEKADYLETKSRIWACPNCFMPNEVELVHGAEKAECKYCRKSFEWGCEQSMFPEELKSSFIYSCRKKIAEQEHKESG